jgi:Subtilase family
VSLSAATKRFRLDEPPFAGLTGRGVTVAVVDSGIQASHPHIARVVGGVHITPTGEDADFCDYLGHGTAVAAAIHEKAPDTELLAVRVFDRRLATRSEILARAIVYAADHGARLINLSLGTTKAEHAELLRRAVDHASSRGAIVVAAQEETSLCLYPGSLPGVVAVATSWQCGRDELTRGAAEFAFQASGFPRPIPGVPEARNLSGISFAVANVSGFLARLLEKDPGIRSAGDFAPSLGDPPILQS